MSQRQIKKLRKYIVDNIEEVLLLIRNECGETTENMGPRQVYQQAKKLYHSNKLKI